MGYIWVSVNFILSPSMVSHPPLYSRLSAQLGGQARGTSFISIRFRTFTNITYTNCWGEIYSKQTGFPDRNETDHSDFRESLEGFPPVIAQVKNGKCSISMVRSKLSVVHVVELLQWPTIMKVDNWLTECNENVVRHGHVLSFLWRRRNDNQCSKLYRNFWNVTWSLRLDWLMKLGDCVIENQ